jgi:hypothetical protein
MPKYANIVYVFPKGLSSFTNCKVILQNWKLTGRQKLFGVVIHEDLFEVSDLQGILASSILYIVILHKLLLLPNSLGV